MTSPNPKTFRVSVPISQDALDRFQLYSEVTGVSVGKSISQWLDDTSEGLLPMIDIIKRTKSIPKHTMNSLTSYASALEQSSAAVIDKAKAGPVGGTHRASQSGQRSQHPTPSPPSSNTGGKVSKKVLQRRGGVA